MTQHRTRRGVVLGGISLFGVSIGAGAAVLASRPFGQPDQDVQSLTWMDLMPPEERMSEAPALTTDHLTDFDLLALEFNGEGTDAPWQPVPQSRPDAKPRMDLDGATVALAGYMTPLEFNARETRAFLLVPYVGACIHVPAPPANQIVLVDSEEPVPVLDMWQPFTAIGTLRVQRLKTDLAESAYVMSLDRMAAIDTSGGPEDAAGGWDMQ